MSNIILQTHQLTPEEKKVTSELQLSVREYVQLRQEKPISQLDESVIKKWCLSIITIAFSESTPNTDGKISPEILQFQTEALVRELTGKFTALTISELKTAFKRGIRGDSGTYFGMCPKTYHQFIKWYFDLPERNRAWLEYLKKVDDEMGNGIKKADKPKLYTPEKLTEIAKQSFQEYKTSGKMPFIPKIIYDSTVQLLKLETLIKKSDWKEIEKESKQLYKEKIKQTKSEILKRMPVDNNNPVYESCVKQVGLKYFYNRMIKENKEL